MQHPILFAIALPVAVVFLLGLDVLRGRGGGASPRGDEEVGSAVPGSPRGGGDEGEAVLVPRRGREEV